MWLFVFLLSLIPASLGCPEMVTSPTELVVGLGSCLYISCHYDLCKVGSDAELRKLRWIHHPQYDTKQQEFTGKKVSELSGTPGNTKGDCSLILPHIRADDAGVYGLRLVGEPNRRYSKGWLWMHYVTINVTDTPPAPHLWLDPDPITQGRRTTFGCWVPPACPKDSPTLTWEGPITKTPGVHMDSWTPPATVTTHPVIGTLLAFDPFWYHDETTVKCILRGSDGKTITQASWQLQVNYAPRNVQVDMTPSSPVHEGQGVTLSCRDSAKPPSHTYTWSLDGRTLPHHTAHVLLEPIQAADGGSYSCQATNVVGTTQSPPTVLQVYYAPRDVRVEVTPSSPVHEGQEVTLSCRDSSNPPSHAYTWSLEGQTLPHHAAQVLLYPTKATDGGSYSCQATNKLGTSRSIPTTLEVYYPPRTAILETLTSLPVLVGSRVTLRCTLGPAHPTPFSIQWLRNDHWEFDTPGPALSFNADPARAGVYRCMGQNPAGTTRSLPLSVIVWYPPKAVKVLQTPRGPVVAWGGLVRLQCQIGAAEPAKFTISWFKNGQELPVPSSELLLPGPEPVDAATYACQARNEAGVTRSPPFILDVRFGPQGVELVPDPSQRVQEMSDVILRCHADASPPPNVFEWFWDGRLLGQTPKGLWVLRAVGTQASGRYRCRVTNDIATTDSPDVIITVYYSTTTILRRTFLGVGVGLSILLVLGTLGCFLRRWWRRQMAAHEEPMVEPSRTFFLRNKKPLMPGSTRPPLGPDDSDTISYASLLSPPGSGSVPRLRGDTVVYTVLKRNEGAAKATEGPDYENVPPGSSNRDRDRDRDRDGTLVYAALALSSPGPPRGQAGDVGDTVEYAALRH
ncbi:B-cell receptor CD22 isoform X1 [Grus americana]|uniref:B-cell receptor CD22 isoform X1 n=1 Tax=Grus americana TaxID=9117 RepID=UPI0024081C06|nr:B-cell receptor CD22 isoform X1 [Grus americana]